MVPRAEMRRCHRQGCGRLMMLPALAYGVLYSGLLRGPDTRAAILFSWKLYSGDTFAAWRTERGARYPD